MKTGLDVGDFAPDFSLKDTKGKTVRLADYNGKDNVLLAFYRGESDIYSINWLKNLDAGYLEIRALGTEVIAISADKENEVTFMRDKYSLSLRLLPDPGCNVIKAYQVYNDFTHTATCAALVIDRTGKIRHKYVSRAPPDLPDNESILATLRFLA
jgi:peroxiredoxin Q/BCP